MPNIEWNDISDWDSSKDSSGIDHNNDPYTSSDPSKLKQGYQSQWPPLTHGLVGWWPLHTDNPVDLSGNGNHGTLNGGVTTGVAGKAGLQAMSLDGSDDHIDFGNVTFSGDKATWSLWVNTTDSGTSSVFGKNLGDPNRSYFLRIGRNNSGKLTFFGSSDGSNHTEVNGSTRIDDGNWHHIVVVFDGQNTELTIYVDGEIDVNETGFYSTLNTNSEELYIGANSGGSAFLDGKVVDFRHYSRTLSQSEIQTLYEWGSSDQASPPTDGTAYYKLDGDTTDSWGSNDGANNGAIFTSDAVRGQAGSFDGSSYIDTGISDFSQSRHWTISMWVDWDGGTTTMIPLGSGDSSTSTRVQVLLNQNAAGGIGTIHDDGSTILKADATDKDYSIGSPIHLVSVLSGDTLNLYANGERVASVTDSSWSSPQDIGYNTYIGAFNTSGSDVTHTRGLIDDVRIYDYALTAQQIQEIYRYGTRGIDMNRFTVMQ